MKNIGKNREYVTTLIRRRFKGVKFEYPKPRFMEVTFPSGVKLQMHFDQVSKHFFEIYWQGASYMFVYPLDREEDESFVNLVDNSHSEKKVKRDNIALVKKLKELVPATMSVSVSRGYINFSVHSNEALKVAKHLHKIR